MAAPLRHFLTRVLRDLEELEEVLRWFQDQVEDLDTSEALEQIEILLEVLRALEGEV